jgi:type I restriction enzyme S subunit
MSEEGYTLPEGWVWARIEDVVQPVGQFNPAATPEAVYRYVDVSSISNQRFEIETPKIVSGATAPTRARQAIYPGDVLVSTVRPYLRNVALVRKHADGDVGSTAFCVLRSNGSVEPGYLFRWTLTKEFSESLAPKQRGISYPAVRDADVLTQQIPLAPLAEQRRIVAKIERLFEQSRSARQGLDRIPPLLKRFRQAILAAAFRGDITHDWREQNPDVEPASALLERIRAERRRTFGKDLRAKGKGARQEEYDGTMTPEIESLGYLPDGWIWSTIGQLFDVSTGGTPSRKKPAYWGGDIPWVSSGEVAFSRIFDTREKITEEGLSNSNAKVHPPGTVLLAMIGEGRTRGQAAILGISASTNQNVAAILCADSAARSEFVYYWLRFHYEETRSFGEGGAQPALNAKKVRTLPLPVPPLAEQRTIIDQVSTLFDQADAIEAAVEATRRRTDKLEQSILARAFRGEQVPQDPKDEPASVLLERIGTDQEMAGASKRLRLDTLRKRKHHAAKRTANG